MDVETNKHFPNPEEVDRDVVALYDGFTKSMGSSGATLTPEIHARGMRRFREDFALKPGGTCLIPPWCIFCGEPQPSLDAFIVHLEGHPG